MIVTDIDFQTNTSKYMSLIGTEDIFITRGGQTIAKIVPAKPDSVSSLIGLLSNQPTSTDAKSIKAERLSRYENHV